MSARLVQAAIFTLFLLSLFVTSAAVDDGPDPFSVTELAPNKHTRGLLPFKFAVPRFRGPKMPVTQSENIQSRPAGQLHPEPAADSASDSPVFEGCSKSRQKSLIKAIELATQKQIEAVHYLDSLEGTDMSGPKWKRFTRWFGKPTRERYQTVRRLFSVLPNQPLSDAIYTCDERKVCKGFWNSLDLYASTKLIPGRGQRIALCLAFWLPDVRATRRAQILIHEWTHFPWRAYGARTTLDLDYGSDLSENLAVVEPESAVRNADNYGFFAMDTPSSGTKCTIL